MGRGRGSNDNKNYRKKLRIRRVWPVETKRRHQLGRMPANASLLIKHRAPEREGNARGGEGSEREGESGLYRRPRAC